MPNPWCGGNSSNGSSSHRRIDPRPHSAPRGKNIPRRECERWFLSMVPQAAPSRGCWKSSVAEPMLWWHICTTRKLRKGGRAMSTDRMDRSTVEAVVNHYFDGLYEGSAEKLGAIFRS